jgi:hypothetical protein
MDQEVLSWVMENLVKFLPILDELLLVCFNVEWIYWVLSLTIKYFFHGLYFLHDYWVWEMQFVRWAICWTQKATFIASILWIWLVCELLDLLGLIKACRLVIRFILLHYEASLLINVFEVHRTQIPLAMLVKGRLIEVRDINVIFLIRFVWMSRYNSYCG